MLTKYLVLILAIIGSAAAQGTSCVPNASPDADGKCKCNTGFSGNAELCCHDSAASKGCYVIGDPVLSTYSGGKAALDFPCGTLLSSAQSVENCRVDVYSGDVEIVNGVIYTRKVLIKAKGSAEVSMEFTLSESGPKLVVTKDINVDTITDFAQAVTVDSEGRVNSNFEVTFDSGLNLFHISGCETDISIRPGVGEGVEQVGGNPGVCVMPSTNADLITDGACAKLSPTSDMTQEELLEEYLKPMKTFLSDFASLSAVQSSDYTQMCTTYKDTLTDDCNSENARDEALKKCAFIMLNPVFRRCFYEVDSNGARGRVFRPFLTCLKTYCTGTDATCDALKADNNIQTCAPNLNDCNTWTPYRENNAFVAGEGDNSEGTQNTQEGGEILGQGDDQSNGGAGGTGEFDPVNSDDAILGSEDDGNTGGDLGGEDSDFDPLQGGILGNQDGGNGDVQGGGVGGFDPSALGGEGGGDAAGDFGGEDNGFDPLQGGILGNQDGGNGDVQGGGVGGFDPSGLF